MHDTLTTRLNPSELDHLNRRCVVARIIAHPDWQRVGEFLPLFDRGSDGIALISRNSPDFMTPTGDSSGPLASARITRTPLAIEVKAGKVRIRHASPSTRVEVNGTPLVGERVLDLQALDDGIVILFGNALALLVCHLDWIGIAVPEISMIGDSSAMRNLRQEIARVAEIDVPVLLRGETGVGKELVAAALHAQSLRALAAYVPVNVAGVPPSLAASELFGHRRGAFSGATDDHRGYFSQADGGTLFLDEIGDIGSEVQALLLRAVDSGVIQPLGGRASKVNVRLIAATDSDLEAAIARNEFREPLLRRFSYEIRIPPLRARRDDIGLLFLYFVRQRLGADLERERLNPPGADPDPWIPASFVADLALHDWPGNVRELSNVALRFTLENRERSVARISDSLKALVHGEGSRNAPTALPERPSERPSLPTDAELVAALKAANFQRERAAKVLGISKSYLYRRLISIPEIRSLSEIPTADVQAAVDASGGDLERAAAELQVSVRALRLRLERSRRSSDR